MVATGREAGNRPGSGDYRPVTVVIVPVWATIVRVRWESSWTGAIAWLGDYRPGAGGNRPGLGDNRPGAGGNRPGLGDNRPGAVAAIVLIGPFYGDNLGIVNRPNPETTAPAGVGRRLVRQ